MGKEAEEFADALTDLICPVADTPTCDWGGVCSECPGAAENYLDLVLRVANLPKDQDPQAMLKGLCTVLIETEAGK